LALKDFLMIIFVLKKHFKKILNHENFWIFFLIYGESGRSRSRNCWQTGAVAEIFDKLEPEPHNNGPVLQTAKGYLKYIIYIFVFWEKFVQKIDFLKRLFTANETANTILPDSINIFLWKIWPNKMCLLQNI
jgi:hypothetical protein